MAKNTNKKQRATRTGSGTKGTQPQKSPKPPKPEPAAEKRAECFVSDCENPVIWLNEDGRKACAIHVTLDASKEEPVPHPSWSAIVELPEGWIERTAMLCHEANRAYCASIGDDSQKPWDEAPEWQKESAKKGVALHMQNPDATAAASHESWMAEKIADGWVYGEKKDEAKKTHPCIVPFEELPVDQQVKDHIFRSVVHSALAQPEPDDLPSLEDNPKTPKTEESHKGWMFEWPALWLIAIAYMRFNRIPVPHLREMPSDSIADGANWHLTRYPNSENLYTLSRVDGMNKRLDLSRELDEDRANLKEAKATAQLAAGHLEKLEVEAFPDERKKYEALLKEKKEQIAQLQHDIPVKEKQYANALKEQSWTVDVKKLSPVVIAEGITRIYRKKDGTPIKTEDGQGT